MSAAAAAPPMSLARERLSAALRSATLITGLAILAFWIVCALLGARIAPQDPYADDLLATLFPADTPERERLGVSVKHSDKIVVSGGKWVHAIMGWLQAKGF